MDRVCAICGADFTRATSMRRHALSHVPQDESRRHKCHICGKGFARADRRDRHMKIHTGEDLENCASCKRGFRRDYIAIHYESCRGLFKHGNMAPRATERVHSGPVVDWHIILSPDMEPRPQTENTGLAKPVQFVNEAFRSTRDPIREAKRAVRNDNLEGLNDLVDLLSSSLAEFQRLYAHEMTRRERRKSSGSEPPTLLEEAVESGALLSLRYLLSPWQKVENAPGGKALLHQAVKYGRQEVITFLVRVKDADLNTRLESFGWVSPLELAVHSENIDTVGHLIDLGCDVSTRGNESRQPLIVYAAKAGREDIVQLLIDKGVSPQTADASGATSLHYAARFGTLAIMQTLIRSGAVIDAATNHFKSSPLCWAADAGQVEAMRILLDSGANVRGIPGSVYQTPLLHACNGSVDHGTSALEVLITANVDLNSLYCVRGLECSTEFTILSIVCRHPETPSELIRRLVEAGAELNVGPPAPLLEAFRCASAEIFELLLTLGADWKKLNLKEIWSPEWSPIPFRDRKVEILDAWTSGQQDVSVG